MLKMKMVRICCGGLALAAVSLLGCTKNEDPRSPSPPPPQPAPTTSSSNTSSSTASSNAMPSTQGEFPGITVAVQELKRGSNTLNLKFMVTTTQSSQGFATYYYLFEKEAHSVDGIHLIDPVGKKKYFVVRDSDGACLCSREVQAIAPGAQSVLWAKFPAPPDDVQKMTVEIPHFPPLEDVPVSR